MPRVRVVLPAPSGPVSTTRSPGRSIPPIRAPSASMSSGDGISCRPIERVESAHADTCRRGTRGPMRVTIS